MRVVTGEKGSIFIAQKLYFGGWSILQASTNQLPIRYSLSYYVLIAIIDIRFITYIGIGIVDPELYMIGYRTRNIIK